MPTSRANLRGVPGAGAGDEEARAGYAAGAMVRSSAFPCCRLLSVEQDSADSTIANTTAVCIFIFIRHSRLSLLVVDTFVLQGDVTLESRPGAPTTKYPGLAARGLANIDGSIGVVTGKHHDVRTCLIQNVPGLHVGEPVVFRFAGNGPEVARTVGMSGL